MKAVWFEEISLSQTLMSLLLKIFEKVLKLQFIRLMGLNIFREMALGSLGMTVMIA